jgi:hypothetical protein
MEKQIENIWKRKTYLKKQQGNQDEREKQHLCSEQETTQLWKEQSQ